MLKQITFFSQAQGRTVDAVAGGDCEGRLYIKFTDGTFAILVPEKEYDDLSIGEDKFDHTAYGVHHAVNLGILTTDELEEMKAEERRKLQEYRDERDRRQYEELRLKFEKKEDKS